MASLIEALTAHLPPQRVHLNTPVAHIWDDPQWQLIVDDPSFRSDEHPHPLVVDTFDQVLLATSLDSTRSLLAALDYDRRLDRLLPTHASSAVLVALAWPPDVAQAFTVPPGFGFLVPPTTAPTQTPQLLACTFVDQKFPHRAPHGARILRAFFGSNAADLFAATPDSQIAQHALAQLRQILGPLPDPTHTTVRRWPRSLPQYEVGHLERMAALEQRITALGNFQLLGNGYHGVGVPDLIRDARAAARKFAESLN